jgi:hypothetical protein
MNAAELSQVSKLRLIHFDEMLDLLWANYHILNRNFIPPELPRACIFSHEDIPAFFYLNNDKVGAKETWKAYKNGYSPYEEIFGAYKKEVEDKVRAADTYDFLELYNCCFQIIILYADIYTWTAKGASRKDLFNQLISIDSFGVLLTTKIFSLLGFWDARMKIGEKNKAGAQARKKYKLENVDKVKDLMGKFPNIRIDRKQKIAFLAEAMRETGVTTTRSIENYLKLLKDK